MPKAVEQITATRDDIPRLYRELLEQNPLLARIEGECRAIGWTEAEIHILQLIAACKSNASLTQRLSELERSLSRRSNLFGRRG